MLFTAKQSLLPADHALLTAHPPPYTPGPYAAAAAADTDAPTSQTLPTLVELCLRALVPYPDEIALPVRLPLRRPRLLHTLIDDPAALDPRLWAVLVQIYDGLPGYLAQYRLPLADVHLPLLQTIPSTAHFSLVTVLSLPACAHLTDDTVHRLRFLHTLAALDASSTALTAYALHSLAATLQPDRRGPWQLRILSLRNCKCITNDAFPHILRFPLLSVLGKSPFIHSLSTASLHCTDLRGTRCLPDKAFPFHPPSHEYDDLYHPAPLVSALESLYDIQPRLYSSEHPFVLNIDSLYHRPTVPAPKVSSVAPQDAFVVVPPNAASIRVGNTTVLQRDIQAREDSEAHQRNKEAWYERQDYEITIMSAKPRPGRRNSPPSGRINQSVWIGGITPTPPSSNLPPTAQSSTNTSRNTASGTPTPRPSTSTNARRVLHHPPRFPNSEFTSDQTNFQSESVSGTANARGAEASTHGARARVLKVPRLNMHARAMYASSSSSSGSRTASSRIPLPMVPVTSLEPIKPKPKRPTVVSTSTISPSNTFDAKLKLYRTPPAWATLDDALQEQKAQAEKRKQQMHAAATSSRREVAMVDMSSARAARVKRELDEVVQKAAKRRKLEDLEVAEPAREKGTRASIGNGAGIVPPLVNESTSRNPFRRRPCTSAPSHVPTSLLSSKSASSISSSHTRVGDRDEDAGYLDEDEDEETVYIGGGEKDDEIDNDFNDDTDLGTTPGSSKTNSSTKPSARKSIDGKVLTPIMDMKIPVLPSEMRKEALARERKESGRSAGIAKSKPQGKNASKTGRKSEGGFDWKTWGGAGK
ncbi:hypothetical protein JR316_0003768 [Psilocybe cubensis]|uniref:Uncharacterized protein n=2 Tax=Psilocybe cubensis TaxID=181762 RepID=A0A8H7Y5T4_PSICU|nr:hypothetical protein JR316_0003768 [Psilocybe cubensis]KAH9484287.1 hypothetical protein JR316_0003768 [Psilocybe cubensis]